VGQKERDDAKKLIRAQRRESKLLAKQLAKANRRVESGIYRISGVPLDKAGLICYIGRAEDLERRKKQHLTGDDSCSCLLIETIRAKGAEPSFTILGKVPVHRLHVEEPRWMEIHEKSGWILWNRILLKGVAA
jgi:hypothetical protein